MAGTGNLTIAGNSSGEASGARSFSYTTALTAVVSSTQTISISNGATTVTVPTGATAVAIIPPAIVAPAPATPYGGTITLKGVSGDTGVPVSVKYPTLIQWDSTSAPATFVLTATASGTVVCEFM